ncbi:hypothetical protein PCANC_14406 [Puccinia coronata f. sp. avenae]|uniref:Integrase catalytic domain-containing protein n=1 Tax=Puccinia coronata f. sp. avenae TaxID=200324 RepID=A0A2N5UZB1_9BASI|nr:hypothetical protein PCANC_14406 [Puccinia coronata f. sp. avenae]
MPPKTTAMLTAKEEKEIITLPIFNGKDYTSWQNAMSAYLEFKQLWSVVEKDVSDGAESKLVTNQLEAWLILNSKIAPEIFTRRSSPVSPDWFGVGSGQIARFAAQTRARFGTFWVWVGLGCMDRAIFGLFKGSGTFFGGETTTQSPNCLPEPNPISFQVRVGPPDYHPESTGSAESESTTVGINVMQSLISADIIYEITEKRLLLMERLLGNADTLSNPYLLLDKLREIANHDQMRREQLAASTSATAAFSTTTQSRKRPPPVYCSDKTHNLESKTHTESECWAIHPHLGNKTKNGINSKKPKAAGYVTTTNENGKIYTGSGNKHGKLTATRKGTAVIQLVDQTTITLTNALYIPNLSTNLILFVQLMKERAEITINGLFMIFKLNSNHQLAVETAQNLFEIIGVKKASARALVSTHGKKSLYQLWHNCYGHASAARIKTVLGNEAEIGNTVTCKACMEGKMIKLPFKGSFTPTTAPLEVVHGNIVGPITPATNTGYRYFLTLVDQHTEFIKITLLKEKSNATTAIVNYKINYKKQTGHSLKKLIPNGGGEFCNNNLGSILIKEGIQHNMAPLYTPQHNKMAERANQTVIGMTQCILIQANMAAEWWGEAAITAPKVNQDRKFDPVAWEGILLGYSNDFSCYKILRVEDWVVVPTRNVRFDEETFPACTALNKSGTIMSSATNSLPIFQMDPVLLFKDSEILNDDSPTREEAKNDDDSEPMEPFPEELESVKASSLTSRITASVPNLATRISPRTNDNLRIQARQRDRKSIILFTHMPSLLISGNPTCS